MGSQWQSGCVNGVWHGFCIHLDSREELYPIVINNDVQKCKNILQESRQNLYQPQQIVSYLVPLYYHFFVCIFIMPCFFTAHSCFHAYNRSFLHFKFSKTIYKKALWTQWPVVGVMLLIIRITVQVIAEKVMIGAHFEEKIRYIYIYVYVYMYMQYMWYILSKRSDYIHIFLSIVYCCFDWSSGKIRM